MKKSKFLAVLLSIIIVMASFASITAFAADDGKITLTPDTSIPAGVNYTLYQILELESYVKETAYSYKVPTAWAGFFTSPAAGATYITVNNDGYAEWTYATKTDSDLQTFAAAALAYAKANGITGDTVTYDGSNAIEWSNLNLGYYLVDSDAGILCNLTTTDNVVTINGKNKVNIVKQVKETTETDYSDDVIVAIGDTVNFKTTVDIYAGAQGYIVHDKMTDGLTLDKASFVLTNAITAITANDYTITHDPVCTEGCTFHIELKQDYLDKVPDSLEIGASQPVTITYDAVLNENAKIHGDSETNNNKTMLEYGKTHKTTWDEVIVDTYKFDLVKYDGDTKKFLTGAEFELYAADGTTQIPVVLDNGVYRVALAGETGENIVVTGGKVTVVGLDAEKIYKLKEIVAPVGYNLLTELATVSMQSGTASVVYQNNTYTESVVGEWHENNGGVAVANNTGDILPSTGSTGTTLFIVFGSIIALCSFVILVARKKSAAYTI